MEYHHLPMQIEETITSITEISESESEILSSLVCNEELENLSNSEILESQEEVKDSEGLWQPSSKEYLNELVSKELQYTANPSAFQRVQTEISSLMRAILLD